MARETSGSGAPVWLGQESEGRDAFGGGQIWVGQHSGDQDIVVFDPSEADPEADVLSMYSLTQHRVRTFPRAAVLERIHPLTDELASARAKRDYAQREALRVAHEESLAAARTERMSRQRDGVVDAHRRFVEALGLEYQGVKDTDPDHRPKRVLRCRTCGIVLDNFAAAQCAICSGTLCSCGACSCGTGPAR